MDSFTVLTGPLAAIDDPPSPPWRVVLASGEEAISQLFHFSLSVGARQSSVESALPAATVEAVERALLGAQVRFRVGEMGVERFGIVAAVHDEGTALVDGATYLRLRLEVVPRAWLLRHRRQSRIFQGKYVHQIVSEVMCKAGVAHRWSLANTYPKRIYCTQYDETDYDFVTRLLAEEGILFFFEHVNEFAGGAAPQTPAAEQSDWDKAADVMGKIGKGVSTAGDLLGSDAIKTAGTGVNLLADWTKTRPKDEEADDPMVIGAGTAGPGGAGDVLVFVDQAAGYPESTSVEGGAHTPLSVSLHALAELEFTSNTIVELAPSQRVRADRVEMRDYDFRRPLLILESKAASSFTPTSVPLEVYDHHGQYEKPEVTAQLAQVGLEQHRADVLCLEGQGPCARLLAGHVFRVENATAAGLPHERYSVVRVRHESAELGAAGAGVGGEIDALARGVAQAIVAASRGADLTEPEIRRMLQRTVASTPGNRDYWSRFECVPSDTAYRPPRPARPPRHVTEVAVVVGPPGQDIYTDRFGRIKIQFNWDREGVWKETSSCWVRVVQPWAGTGFGFQFIPRVGMEVLVTFLAGDPDRPVVLGSLYNATHATPEPLPQRLTRSGIRSQSTPNGGGFNEISFEDQAGVERIHLHAQKDLHEIVNDTRRSDIKGKQVVQVGNTMEVGVGGDQRWAVGGSLSEIVGKDGTLRVGGSQVTDVHANRTERVHGSTLSTVSGVALRNVKKDEAQVVEGNLGVSVLGDMITQVGGRTSGAKSHSITFVEGTATLTATERVLIKAEKPGGDGAQSSLRLECGESYIEIGPEKITLRAKHVEILGDETAHLRGDESVLALSGDGTSLSADPIQLTTPDGSDVTLSSGNLQMTGPSGAVVQGSSIALRSGQGQGQSQSSSTNQEQTTPNLKLVFSHLRQTGQYNRIANTKYRIVADDQVLEGTTDAQGKVQVHVPPAVKVVYVVLWANERYSDIYPREEGPLHWLVRIQPSLPAATELPGARARLRNLGYEPGTKLDEETLDPSTRAALLEFQIDQDLPPTGELDDATKTKIGDVYGS